MVLWLFKWYNLSMKKALIETNPYLKDSEQRHRLLYTSVLSSTAIEGVHTAVTKINPSKKINIQEPNWAVCGKHISETTKKPTKN